MDLNAAKRIHREAADKAQAHLISLLRARDIPVEIINHNVVAKRLTGIKTRFVDDSAVETSIHVWPFTQRYFSEPKGISIRIGRRVRPVTYSRKTTDIMAFDWNQIITTIVNDLDFRVSEAKRYHAQSVEVKSNQQAADEEVPLPDTGKPRFPFQDGSYLEGFERTRQSDGTYTIRLNLTGVSVQTAIALRDLVLAHHASLKPNTNAKTQETNSSSPAQEQEARTA